MSSSSRSVMASPGMCGSRPGTPAGADAPGLSVLVGTAGRYLRSFVGYCPLRGLRRPGGEVASTCPLGIHPGLSRLLGLAPLHPDEDGDAEQEEHEALGEPLLARAPDRPHRVRERERGDYRIARQLGPREQLALAEEEDDLGRS